MSKVANQLKKWYNIHKKSWKADGTMGYVEGISRDQTMMLSFDEMVAKNSMARVIDKFIDVCDMASHGFARTNPSTYGRPSYAPQAMAKLYLY